MITLSCIHTFWSGKPHAFTFISQLLWPDPTSILHLLTFTRLIKKAAFVCICIYWVGTEGDSHSVELWLFAFAFAFTFIKESTTTTSLVGIIKVDISFNRPPILCIAIISILWLVKLGRFCVWLNVSVQDWATISVYNGFRCLSSIHGNLIIYYRLMIQWPNIRIYTKPKPQHYFILAGYKSYWIKICSEEIRKYRK